jgi:hypothetical protein
VDVTETAKEAGFKIPVALTQAAWVRCVEVPGGVSCQDEAGRLWDVLWMLALAIRRDGDGQEVRFALHVRNDDGEGAPPLVRLKSLCGPGDQGEPALTAMMPEEDQSGKRKGAARMTVPAKHPGLYGPGCRRSTL